MSFLFRLRIWTQEGFEVMKSLYPIPTEEPDDKFFEEITLINNRLWEKIRDDYPDGLPEKIGGQSFLLSYGNILNVISDLSKEENNARKDLCCVFLSEVYSYVVEVISDYE